MKNIVYTPSELTGFIKAIYIPFKGWVDLEENEHSKLTEENLKALSLYAAKVSIGLVNGGQADYSILELLND